jgi:hypothetical protein
VTSRWVVLLVAVAAIAVQTAASADPSPRAQAEIAYLLGVVGASGCDFNRNGSWYDAQRAQEHLRGKYEYLVQRDRVATAEEFIDRVAARSSITGKPYLIKCGAGKTVTSEEWLRAALQRYRVSPGSR